MLEQGIKDPIVYLETMVKKVIRKKKALHGFFWIEREDWYLISLKK